MPKLHEILNNLFLVYKLENLSTNTLKYTKQTIFFLNIGHVYQALIDELLVP